MQSLVAVGLLSFFATSSLAADSAGSSVKESSRERIDRGPIARPSERGTYDLIKLVAYQYRGKKLQEVWRWDNSKEPKTYWGQGAHWMHAADIDGDGCDEVIIGSAAIDHQGKALWSTGLGHPDHSYVGKIDPDRAGLQIYYGIETKQKANGMCLVDAATGKR